MKLNIFVFILFLLYSFLLNASNIRVVDLNRIIDNNKTLLELVSKIEEDQLMHREKYKNNELLLQSKLAKIDELKLILENTELQKEILTYNEQLNQFNLEIKKFNIHYEDQLNKLRSKILNRVLEILKKYSQDNKIDLILDSNNYILSSNTINITNIILDELNKINFDISFEKY